MLCFLGVCALPCSPPVTLVYDIYIYIGLTHIYIYMQKMHTQPTFTQLEFAPSVPATLPADSPDDSKPALPAPVDVAATGIPPEPVPPSSNGGGPVVPASVTPASPPSTLASEAAASVVAGGAAAAAKVAVKAKPADATAKAGDGSEVCWRCFYFTQQTCKHRCVVFQASMRNMVTNASNLSSVAAAAAAVALTPDDIFSSHQDGVMVTGSWDEI